jgi:hypothetical protein
MSESDTTSLLTRNEAAALRCWWSRHASAGRVVCLKQGRQTGHAATASKLQSRPPHSDAISELSKNNNTVHSSNSDSKQAEEQTPLTVKQQLHRTDMIFKMNKTSRSKKKWTTKKISIA